MNEFDLSTSLMSSTLGSILEFQTVYMIDASSQIINSLGSSRSILSIG